ncbi:MAG: hypothetical protein Q3998_07790 [Porphyromonas sp.]|nr:hypothetical protein [Porphyromonas sp.]
MATKDAYYSRGEVSNSDLTELKNLIHPQFQLSGDKERAFKMGTLVDALITEPEKIDFYGRKIDDYLYSKEEFEHGRRMREALKREAQLDPFLARVLNEADTQTIMVNTSQMFDYSGFQFSLDTRCKWDWFFSSFGFGGDLKTTSASTQAEFENAIDAFDWDRSRAWYMDIAGSDKDFIYAISKKNFRVFKKFIQRGDETYMKGREKYEELAFKYWCFVL